MIDCEDLRSDVFQIWHESERLLKEFTMKDLVSKINFYYRRKVEEVTFLGSGNNGGNCGRTRVGCSGVCR